MFRTSFGSIGSPHLACGRGCAHKQVPELPPNIYLLAGLLAGWLAGAVSGVICFRCVDFRCELVAKLRGRVRARVCVLSLLVL